MCKNGKKWVIPWQEILLLTSNIDCFWESENEACSKLIWSFIAAFCFFRQSSRYLLSNSLQNASHLLNWWLIEYYSYIHYNTENARESLKLPENCKFDSIWNLKNFILKKIPGHSKFKHIIPNQSLNIEQRISRNFPNAVPEISFTS